MPRARRGGAGAPVGPAGGSGGAAVRAGRGDSRAGAALLPFAGPAANGATGESPVPEDARVRTRAADREGSRRSARAGGRTGARRRRVVPLDRRAARILTRDRGDVGSPCAR